MTTTKKINSKTNRRKIAWDFGMTSVLILFLFRIPISNILGSDGNGYFAIAWETGALFSVLFGCYVGRAITSMVKRRNSKQQFHNSTQVLNTALVYSSLISVLGAVILYFWADFITGNLFGVKLSRLALQLSAVWLVIYVITNVFRGYFEGMGTKVPTYFSKIIEVLTGGTVACIVATILGNYGKKVGALLFDEQYKASFSATGLMLGAISGIIIALLFLLVVNFIYQIPLKEMYKKDETKVPEQTKHLLVEIWKNSVIASVPLFCFQVYRLLNMIIYLKSSKEDAIVLKTIQQLGSYHGKVLVLLGIVAVILLGFGSGNIRRIHHYYIKNNFSLCMKYLKEDLKRFLVSWFILAGILFIGGEKILKVFFQKTSPTEVKMLQIGCFGVIFVVIAIYLYRLLILMKKEMFLIISSLMGVVTQTVLMVVLVKLPELGIASIISAETLFWCVITLLEGLCIFSVTSGKKIPLGKNF